VPTSPRSELAALVARYRRPLLRHRRLAAALLAGAAVLVALRVVAPAPPPSSVAVVAAHDLDAGTRLGAGDITVVRVAAALMPQHGVLSVDAAVGRVLAAPVRQGEVLTDRAVVGAALVDGYPEGTVAAAIRLPDADLAALLHTGDRIDVYAAQAELGQPASLVVADVEVITVPAALDERARQGALVVLAATPDQSARLAQAAATAPITIAIRG
jgi:Flp pilus assembly protein CpaB